MRYHAYSASMISRPTPRRRYAIVLAVLVFAVSAACSAASATPVAPPTTTVDPSPTFTTEPTPTATSRPVEIESIPVDAFAVLEEFLEELGPRASATEQELAAARYIQSRFDELGYSTNLQTFPVDEIVLAGLGLTLDTPQPQEFAAEPLFGAGLGDVSGVLTPVGLAMPGDIPEEGLEGRIALARRGVITFQSKADNVFAAGAVGLVIYNDISGLFQGVLSTQAEFPVISLSKEDGEAIQSLLTESDIEASIALRVEETPSQNVIAEKTVSAAPVVVLGGHYDSIPGTSGANDNASGAAVLLAIAESLAEVELPFTLRLIAFGSEELGLLGSQFYVESLSEEELDRTRVMLNFDAVGSGNGVSVFGNREVTELASAVGSAIGIDIAVTPGISGGSSDFASFQAVGVPFLMFYGDDFSRIHSDGDTIEFVQAELLNGATAIATALLQSEAFEELIVSE